MPVELLTRSVPSRIGNGFAKCLSVPSLVVMCALGVCQHFPDLCEPNRPNQDGISVRFESTSISMRHACRWGGSNCGREVSAARADRDQAAKWSPPYFLVTLPAPGGARCGEGWRPPFFSRPSPETFLVGMVAAGFSDARRPASTVTAHVCGRGVGFHFDPRDGVAGVASVHI
jgi:hypothetical protein